MRFFVLMLAVSTLSLASCTSSTKEVPSGSSQWSAPTTTILPLRDAGGKFELVECGGAVSYRVAREGAHDDMARAIVNIPSGEERIVSFVGRKRDVPNATPGTQAAEYIVDRFLGVWPEETCEKIGVRTPVNNTYWKLVEMNGVRVTTHDNQREMHVLFRVDGQVGGFGGCNALSGRYQLNGDRIRIMDVVSTLMACEYLEDEQAFVEVLSRATNCQSVGESLQLRDDNGPLARFVAVYMP